MILKRNLFTILYSIFFLLLMGAGFAIQIGLLLSNEAESYLNVCILVLGLIIFLLASFFIKEKGIMQAVESGDLLYVILEIVLVAASAAGIVYLNFDRSAWPLILLMLLLTYATARFLGGRLCGIFGLLLSLFYLVGTNGYTVVDQEFFDCFCFLVPFMLFLLIVHVLTPKFGGNGFLIISSYFILSVLFTFAIVVNPVVFILLLGCVFALIFGRARQGGISSSGPVLAGVLFGSTLLFLLAAWFFLGDLLTLPEWSVDGTLFSGDSLSSVTYIQDKYAASMSRLYEPFASGIFPSVLLFMSAAAGYYAIRKKASGVGPLCLSLVFLAGIYFLFGEYKSSFYYMIYFLPVFAAYGMTNALLPETQSAEKEMEGGKEPAGRQEEEDDLTLELEEDEHTEPVYELSMEDSQDELVNEPLLKPEEDMTEETAEQPEESAVEFFEEDDAEEEVVRKQMNTNIPEWKVSEGFLQSQQNTVPERVEEFVENMDKPADIMPEEKETPEDSIPLVQETLEDSVTSDLSSEPVDMISVEKVQKPDELVSPAVPEITEENVTLDSVETTDLEFFTDMDGADDNMLTPRETDVSSGADDMLYGFSSEDNSLTVPAAEKETDSEEDETKLNDLLNRLDISDHIRRMNESAQEDMADVIERDEENIELSSAIPAEEIEEVTETVPDNDFMDISGLTFEDEQDSTPQPETLSQETLPAEEETYVMEDLPVENISEETVEPRQLEFSADPEELQPDLAKPDSPQDMDIMQVGISEYDKVPTINDLERKWRNVTAHDSAQMENGFAYSLEDIPGADVTLDAAVPPVSDLTVKEEAIEKEPPAVETEEEIRTVEEQVEESKVPMQEIETPAREVIDRPYRVSRVIEDDGQVDSAREVHLEEIVKKKGQGKRSYYKITWK